MIFVDSCFYIALADKKDQWHTKARNLTKYVENKETVISDLIISEVLTEMGKRSGGKKAHQIFEYFIDNCEIIYVNSDLLVESESHFLKFDGTLSLADAVSATIMLQKGIWDILSFDSDFDKVDGINRICE
jgi:predicted nucleic acid-binding protein